MTATNTGRRLFFALWPDDETRRQLAAVAREICERPVPVANLHMTLIFLGRVSEQQQACFCQAAGEVRAAPFELTLERLDFWKRYGIQWLGSSAQGPSALPELVDSLGRALTRCGYETGKRDFIPHVTLSRKTKKPALDTRVKAIRWAVQDYVLAESVPVEGGVIYRLVQRWPLARG